MARGEAVQENTHLPTPFSYVLNVGGDSIGARFGDGCLAVSVPRETALDWARTDQVSLHGRQGDVAILVEKDFECLEPRPGEDDTDAFPNPKARDRRAR